MERSSIVTCGKRTSWVAAAALVSSVAASAQPTDEAGEETRAARIVGPETAENNCASCHVLEAQAWRATRHFLGFEDRHRTDRAKEILRNLGERSMKRGTVTNLCRQCHYTSVPLRGRVEPAWGVSCESCHAPARDWIKLHDVPGGDPAAAAIDWGTGKAESPGQRAARLGAAAARGMVHSEMIDQLAQGCLGCHAVPNEKLVNDGNHKAGSDFDLVAWSQGEVRHNFASSPGAPDRPTNAPASPEQRRRLYVVGALADLEFSLRNLAGVTQRGGTFHLAMIERVNRLRERIERMLAAVEIPEVAAVIKQLPATIGASTAIGSDLPEKLHQASRLFVSAYDSTTLAPIDQLIPTELKGQVYEARTGEP
jgi:cytochrome c554/c'-like protein